MGMIIPSGTTREQDCMKLVYLDLNHWIGLAKARVGHPDGKPYSAALDALARAVESSAVALPLSSAHYEEMSGITDVRQRADIALTMDRLSGYLTIAGRDHLLRAQLLRAIARWRRLSVDDLERETPFGFGVAFAFGQPIQVMSLKGPEEAKEAFYTNGAAVVEKLEQLVGTGWTFRHRASITDNKALIDAAIREATEFVLLRGPRPEDTGELKRHGYDIQTSRDAIEHLASRERELTTMLAAGVADRRRLEDIVRARLWVWELDDIVAPVLNELGIEPTDLFDVGGKAALSAILHDMPTMNVEFVLRRANFRNGSYTWKTNDIHDLAFLGKAVPYCDIVVTEKHAAQQLRMSKIDERYGTTVLRDIDELPDLLYSAA